MLTKFFVSLHPYKRGNDVFGKVQYKSNRKQNCDSRDKKNSLDLDLRVTLHSWLNHPRSLEGWDSDRGKPKGKVKEILLNRMLCTVHITMSIKMYFSFNIFRFFYILLVLMVKFLLLDITFVLKALGRRQMINFTVLQTKLWHALRIQFLEPS